MDNKSKKIIKDIEDALGIVESIGIEYTAGAYKYFMVRDCYGNVFKVQELQRMTRWQWRVFSNTDYFEISGKNQTDFNKLWEFLVKNKITIKPN